MLSLSSKTGKDPVREIFQNLWPHTPRDYQIEAVANLLDGIDVLAILPTGSGKNAAPVMPMLLSDLIQLNPERFPSNCRRFPAVPIAVVVCTTNCLKEEQVCDCRFKDEFTRSTGNLKVRPPRSGRQD